jgi:outer membrane protein assembly factor BamB
MVGMAAVVLPVLPCQGQEEPPRLGSPSVADGVLFFGADNGILYAVDIETGTQLWQIATGGGRVQKPTVADGMLYVGIQAGFLLAIDTRTGNERWRFETGDVDWPIRDRFVNGTPTVLDDMVYFSSEDWNVYALDAQTGLERWRFRLGEEPQALEIPIRDDVAYVGSWDGYLYAIDVTTGRLKWRSRTDSDHRGRTLRDDEGNLYWESDDPKGETEPHQAPYVTVVPIVADDAVYFTDWSGNLMAVDLDDGGQRWRFRADVIDARHVGSRFYISRRGDVLYFATLEDKHLYGIDSRTGAKVWERETPNPVYGPLPEGGDVILYLETPLDDDGNFAGIVLKAIDAETNKPLWTLPGLSDFPYVEGDRIYAPLVEGSVVAVDRREGSEVWRFERVRQGGGT